MSKNEKFVDPQIAAVHNIGYDRHGSFDALEYFLRLAGEKISEEDARYFRRRLSLLGARNALNESREQQRLINSHPENPDNPGRESLVGFLETKARKLRRVARGLNPKRR